MLVWCDKPHAWFGQFLGQITRVIFENFEIALVLLGQFQFFQKCTRAIYPPNHAITSSSQVPFQENLSNRF